MPKFTAPESTLIKSIVASLSIKRIPEPEIINEIYYQTNKTISKVALFNIKKRIKWDSYHWYKTMRNGEFEYVHEFRERINEILFLQKEASSDRDEKRRQPTGSTDFLSRITPAIYYIKQSI